MGAPQVVLVVKLSPASAGARRERDARLTPGLGLQRSCQENSTDRRAWRPSAYRAAKSVKWLSMLTFCLWTLILPLFRLFLFVFSWLCYMACGMLVASSPTKNWTCARCIAHRVLSTRLPGKYLCLPFIKMHVTVFRTHQLIQNYLFILWILTWSHVQRLFFLIK